MPKDTIKEYTYAVTSKKTRQPVTQQHYLDYLDSLKDEYAIYNVNFETTRGLHVHYMLTSHTKLDFKDLYKTKYGWNHKAVPIYNRTGWESYIRKDYELERSTANIYKQNYNDPDHLDPRTLPRLF